MDPLKPPLPNLDANLSGFLTIAAARSPVPRLGASPSC
jgi:hypothetical protein